MRKGFLAIVFLVFCPLLVAQQSLNNDSIVKLVKAGLSEDLIVSTINASPGTYDTSADGLIALKHAGVSDKIVAQIVLKSTAPAPSAQPPIPPLDPMPGAIEQGSTDPDNPAAPHEAGVYIFSDSSPAGTKMIMLKPSFCTQNKVSGAFSSAMTYGIAKVKIKDVVSGAHASLRITDSQPTFYFYFEDLTSMGNRNSSLTFGPSIGMTQSPIGLLLRKFDTHGDTREALKSFNADNKTLIGFTFTKLRPGAFKVTLNGPLSPGEYGFIAPLGNSVFDFGKD